jgi:histidyl-tRNA synthetase
VFQAPRGTTDILPEDQDYWAFVQSKAVEISNLYGYRKIDTPVFEETGLFTRSVGEGTDIVQKEMYSFEDRGGGSMTLRPEGTAPVCRAYLEHGMQNLPQPVKLYYLFSLYRYERPQAGRYREFHQFGCEAVGDTDPALDAEVIDMAWQFFSSLGLKELHLKLNSIGCPVCRPEYLKELKDYYRNYSAELCDDCRSRFENNPLRLLDCKNPNCRKLSAAAPKSCDHLCPDCAEHFDRLKKYLEALDLPYEVDHRLVRGLDYYTRTVFEIQPEEEGAQSTIGGGGRYDRLIEELGGKPTPAVGFAIGLERIIAKLKKQNVEIPPAPSPRVFIAYLGDEAGTAAVKLTGDLRRQGVSAVQSPAGKSLKAQMKLANKLCVKYAVILGEDELKSGSVQMRDMQSSEQKTISMEQLFELLK